MSIRSLLIGAAVSALTANALAQTPPPPADVPPPPPPSTSTPSTSPAEPTPPQPGALPTSPAQPPTAAPMPPPFPAPTPPVPPPPAAAEAPPKKLTVGKEGWFQPGMLLQGWFLFDGCPSCVAPTPSTTTTFRLRRVEINAKGEIIPGLVGYGVMFDLAKVLETQSQTVNVINGSPTNPALPGQVVVRQAPAAISVLQDVFITFQSEYADVSLGQFKIPVSWEGYNSASKIVFPERSLVSRTYGDRRDMGLRVAKTTKYFGYSGGIFSGQGLNNLDTNNQKDLALRLEAYPIPGITVAGVIYGSVGQRDLVGTKDRYEADVRLDLMNILVQAEYIYANDVVTPGTSVNGQGFYALGGYTFFDVLQPVVRIGRIDPNTGTANDYQWEYGAGLNYYLRKQEMNLKINYNNFPQARNQDEIIFAAQVSY